MIKKRDGQQPKMVNRRRLLQYVGISALASSSSLLLPKKAAANSFNHAIWLHGAGVQSEDNLVGQRTGFHARFPIINRNKIFWFHFPVSIPVILSSQRTRISAICLVFETTYYSDLEKVAVQYVDVYDGTKLILRHSVNLFSEQPFVRLEIPDQPNVSFGINISIGVSLFTARKGFVIVDNEPHPWYGIKFLSAGVELI